MHSSQDSLDVGFSIRGTAVVLVKYAPVDDSSGKTCFDGGLPLSWRRCPGSTKHGYAVSPRTLLLCRLE